jgi:hypothetical protein
VATKVNETAVLLADIMALTDSYILAKSDPTRWTARFVNWGEQHCYGHVQRCVCVFGVGDLPSLLNRYELFANKFQLKTDPIAHQCQEQLILTRSRGDLPLNNATYYRHMPFLVPS